MLYISSILYIFNLNVFTVTRSGGDIGSKTLFSRLRATVLTIPSGNQNTKYLLKIFLKILERHIGIISQFRTKECGKQRVLGFYYMQVLIYRHGHSVLEIGAVLDFFLKQSLM